MYIRRNAEQYSGNSNIFYIIPNKLLKNKKKNTITLDCSYCEIHHILSYTHMLIVETIKNIYCFHSDIRFQ